MGLPASSSPCVRQMREIFASGDNATGSSTVLMAAAAGGSDKTFTAALEATRDLEEADEALVRRHDFVSS